MQRPLVILWSIVAVVVTVAAVLWSILIARWSGSDSTEATSPAPPTTATTSATAAAAALAELIPAGYPPGSCAPEPTDAYVTAAMFCGPNTDPGGPTSSTYTLSGDSAALQASFTDTVNRSTPRICPPNIQSPGPWRRNDTPTVERGTVFCGLQANQPVVVWTEDDELLLSIVRAETPGATLEGLYAWWSSHS